MGIIGSLLILGFRQIGFFEPLELMSYDWLIRSSYSADKADERIVLITVNESDIENQGQWPLPDGILARVLETIISCDPQAVGLDIYRDVPVPPGTSDFENVLIKNPQILLKVIRII